MVTASPNDEIIDYFTADVVTANDYYPGGMLMPGRKYSSTNGYRYGFNGKEKDNETYGDANTYDFGARIYDPRLGRFLSPDPEEKIYVWQSTYAFASNNPVRFIDINGKGTGDPITVSRIVSNFNLIEMGGANTYKFTLYVDQPTRNSNSQVKDFTEVGHTFIKLTKTNKFGVTTEQIFGFYPDHKDGKKAGSPFDSKVASTFKNDSNHPWDVQVTAKISAEEFKKVLDIAANFEKSDYCLAGANCSDFGIAATEAVGIKLPKTSVGIILTGEGVTPGQLGQDLREDVNKIKNGQKPLTSTNKNITIIRALGKDTEDNQQKATSTGVTY